MMETATFQFKRLTVIVTMVLDWKVTLIDWTGDAVSVPFDQFVELLEKRQRKRQREQKT